MKAGLESLLFSMRVFSKYAELKTRVIAAS